MEDPTNEALKQGVREQEEVIGEGVKGGWRRGRKRETHTTTSRSPPK